MADAMPIYSHNPYDATKFPLLVLDVKRRSCVPSNEGFRVFHWHDEVQFVYILKGSVHFRIYDEEMDLKEGDCMFINRAALHQITEKQDCRYHSYIVPIRMLSFFAGSIMEERDVKTVAENPLLTHYAMRVEDVRCRNVLKEICVLDRMYFKKKEKMADNADDLQRHWEYRLSIQLTRLWLELIESFSEIGENSFEKICDPDQIRSHERIRRMLAFVHENYDKEIFLKDIAKAAHISATECQRCFHTYVQCPPYQYLMKYRLERSTALLASADRTITEIAEEVGFHSVSAYIKYFKKFYGVTPLKYRKEKDNKSNVENNFHYVIMRV